MNKYKVTFHFATCSPIVEVQADSNESAIVAARGLGGGEPVPVNIRTTVEKIARGGARIGAGRKSGVTSGKARTVRKYIRWTDKDWRSIVDRAAAFGMSTADYQRSVLLQQGEVPECVSDK